MDLGLPLALTGRIVTEVRTPSHLPGKFEPLLPSAAATLSRAGLHNLPARRIRWRLAPR